MIILRGIRKACYPPGQWTTDGGKIEPVVGVIELREGCQKIFLSSTNYQEKCTPGSNQWDAYFFHLQLAN